MLYFINRGKEYMEKTSKVRESSFELMRIISMFMIVVWHVIICGVGLDQVSESLSFSFDTIKSLFVVHVNSFVLFQFIMLYSAYMMYFCGKFIAK